MIDQPIRDLRESWAHFVASDCDGGFADLHDAIEVILDDEPLYSAARDLLEIVTFLREWAQVGGTLSMYASFDDEGQETIGEAVLRVLAAAEGR